MSSDPKEPTPLSVEAGQEPDFLSWLVARANEDRFYDAATLFPQAVEYGRQCEAEIQRKAATIDAQATEIAALKGALADAADHMMWMLGGWDDRHDDALPRAHEGIGKALVLAGKGAQCPKCEGRGFIRTMVDGERDSEPCSFCRMSGLAGKEAQGD